MGLGQLKDAALRERRRRLLGVDMAAAARRSHRAQLGALVNGAHRHLTATASSEESLFQTGSSEERSHAVAATGQETRGFMTEGPCKLGNMLDDSSIHDFRGMYDPVELLCSNATSECRRPHALLIGATATSEETRASETLCSNNALADSHPQAQLTGVALVTVDGVLQTHSHAITATIIEEARALETLIPGQHNTLFSSSSAVGKFCKVEDSQDSDSDNDSMIMPIFVRHVSGELTFNVGMDQSIKHLMKMYVQRTKTTLDNQYFVYERKRLEPHHTWLSYGIKRDTTVHVCTRLLGGADHPNLQDYVNNNKRNFVQVVSLPDGRASLKMTILGCRFLSSWIRCLTAAFIKGRSWNGEFELLDFKFVEGHVCPIKKARKHVKPSSVGDDIRKFADLVESILEFSHVPNVVSKHPPYVPGCMKMLRDLVGSGVTGPLTAVAGPISNNYKLLLDTLVCCMTSYARERLIIKLLGKYDGANENEAPDWRSAINDANCSETWLTDLTNNVIFDKFIQEAKLAKPYPKKKIGAFFLLRDVLMHAADSSENPSAPTLGDGIELMIPANEHLDEFLPSIIKNLIEKNIDITAELSAAIQCACNICDS